MSETKEDACPICRHAYSLITHRKKKCEECDCYCCKKCMVADQTSDVIKSMGFAKKIDVCKFCHFVNTKSTMSIKDKGLIMSDYFEHVLKRNQPLLVKQMLRFLAALLLDSPLAIKVNFKDYTDCMKMILDYANPDSAYSMEATKVILTFLLVGRQDYFKLLFSKDNMFKLALILEMVGSPDSDDIQNLFLDNHFLIDLLFAARNLELLLEFSKTLANLNATERGTANYTKVMDALKQMNFSDFLLHCESLNINEADQAQFGKKYQLVQNCWKLMDRRDLLPRANDFLDLSRKMNPVLPWTIDFQRNLKRQFMDAFEKLRVEQITQYSQTISKDNFFHLVLLMFQDSDTLREKTVTAICKMIKTAQGQAWVDILRREFFFVPIGRTTTLLDLIMANNVGPGHMENTLSVIGCIPNELRQNFWQTFPNKIGYFDSVDHNLSVAQTFMLDQLKDCLWFHKMTLDTCPVNTEEFIVCRRSILSLMKLMYTKKIYLIAATLEYENWLPDTMNKILLQFLTNEDRMILYTFFKSIIDLSAHPEFEKYVASQASFFAEEYATSDNAQLESLCFFFVFQACKKFDKEALLMGNIGFAKKLLNRFEQTLPDQSKVVHNDDDYQGLALFDEPEEQNPIQKTNVDIFYLLMRCIHRGALNEEVMDEIGLVPLLHQILERRSNRHLMLLCLIAECLKGVNFGHVLAKHNTLEFFHDFISKHADDATALEVSLFLKISKTYPIEKHVEKLPLYIQMEPLLSQRREEHKRARVGYNDLRNSIFYNDIWQNIYDDCADVLKGELILRDIENPLVTQVLDEQGYSWRCLINSVPTEIFLSILSNLTLQQLVNAGRVCSVWSALTSSDQVWKHIYEQEWGLELPDHPYKEAYRRKIAWVKRMVTQNKGQSAVVGSLISHGGKVSSGEAGVIVGSSHVAVQGSQVMCDIHGKTYISKVGQASTTVGGKGVARVGDKCACGAVIISGSESCKIQ